MARSIMALNLQRAPASLAPSVAEPSPPYRVDEDTSARVRLRPAIGSVRVR